MVLAELFAIIAMCPETEFPTFLALAADREVELLIELWLVAQVLLRISTEAAGSHHAVLRADIQHQSTAVRRLLQDLGDELTTSCVFERLPDTEQEKIVRMAAGLHCNESLLRHDA